MAGCSSACRYCPERGIMLPVDETGSMIPQHSLNWVLAHCRFAQGLPPINPGLNLNVIAEEVADHLRKVDGGEINVGNMLRALELKGRNYKEIRKRASDMGVDFFAMVTDILHGSAV
jgi:hypothetical protein